MSVGNHIGTYDGDKKTAEGKEQPGIRAVSPRDVNVHAEESCDEGRKHEGKGDYREPLHDDVHVVADNGGKGIHRSGEDVRIYVGHCNGLLVISDDIIKEVGLILVVELEDRAFDHLLKQHLIACQACRQIDKRLLYFKKLDQLIGISLLVRLVVR